MNQTEKLSMLKLDLQRSGFSAPDDLLQFYLDLAEDDLASIQPSDEKERRAVQYASWMFKSRNILDYNMPMPRNLERWLNNMAWRQAKK